MLLHARIVLFFNWLHFIFAISVSKKYYISRVVCMRYFFWVVSYLSAKIGSTAVMKRLTFALRASARTRPYSSFSKWS